MHRSQSALEYMMTYGWAILIIVIVAGVLYSFGVFNPSSSTSATVTGFPGLGSVSAACNPGGALIFSFGNDIGSTINITAINVTLSNGTKEYSPFNQILPAQISNLFLVQNGCSPSDAITVTYTEPSSVFPGPYYSSGTITNMPKLDTFTYSNTPSPIDFAFQLAGAAQFTYLGITSIWVPQPLTDLNISVSCSNSLNNTEGFTAVSVVYFTGQTTNVSMLVDDYQQLYLRPLNGKTWTNYGYVTSGTIKPSAGLYEAALSYYNSCGPGHSFLYFNSSAQMASPYWTVIGWVSLPTQHNPDITNGPLVSAKNVIYNQQAVNWK